MAAAADGGGVLLQGVSGVVTVEFYGVPRQRAGVAELTVEAGTVDELLGAVARACPGWRDLRRGDGRLAAHYAMSVEGERFVIDVTEPLRPGERVLLLSADAGG